jgi:S-adenosylmethionine hydrolase
MSIITLTTDFGIKDYHPAFVKGAIWKRIPDAKIIDVSHEIKPFDIPQLALFIQAALKNFPDNTIHFLGVEAEYQSFQKHLVVKVENQFLIGADNGVFSLIESGTGIQKIVEVKHPLSKSTIAPMQDVFPDVAQQILADFSLKGVGDELQEVNHWKKVAPDMSDSDVIIAHVIYVDRFGNIFTDLKKADFDMKIGSRKFSIVASHHKISKVFNKYSDFTPELSQEGKLSTNAGKVMAVFNSLGLLEIALFKSNPEHGGHASKLLGIKVGDSIRIEIE